MRTIAAITTIVCALSTPALAKDTTEDKDPADPTLEASFAFVSGQRSYDGAEFGYERGSGSQVLSAPFRSPALSGMGVTGYGFDLRFIARGVRFSVGWDRPYVRSPEQPQTLALASGQTARVRAVETKEFRLGLGVQHAGRHVSVHADVIGSADVVEATLTTGDQQAIYQSRNFSFALRGGITRTISEFYFAHLSGEVGLVGNIDWSMSAGVGLRL